MRETGDLSSALAAAQEAIRLRPQDASAHHVLGLILCEMQEAGRASAAFAEAVRLRPDWAEAHANYGRMLLTLGELNKGWAEHEWRRRLTHSAHELVGAAWSGADPFGRTILLYG